MALAATAIWSAMLLVGAAQAAATNQLHAANTTTGEKVCCACTRRMHVETFSRYFGNCWECEIQNWALAGDRCGYRKLFDEEAETWDDRCGTFLKEDKGKHEGAFDTFLDALRELGNKNINKVAVEETFRKVALDRFAFQGYDGAGKDGAEKKSKPEREAAKDMERFKEMCKRFVEKEKAGCMILPDFVSEPCMRATATDEFFDTMSNEDQALALQYFESLDHQFVTNNETARVKGEDKKVKGRHCHFFKRLIAAVRRRQRAHVAQGRAPGLMLKLARELKRMFSKN